MRWHTGRIALALALLLILACDSDGASRSSAEAEGTPLSIVPIASGTPPAAKAAEPAPQSEPARKAEAATPAAGQAKQKKAATPSKAKSSTTAAGPVTLKAPPPDAGRAGPYIATEPKTGATILGVSHPAPSNDAADNAPLIVVPEIEVPAQQPQGQAQTYRPGAEQQPPNVYRPGGE